MLARLLPNPHLPVSSQAPSPLFFLHVFLGYLFRAKSDGQRRTWQDLGYSPSLPSNEPFLHHTKPSQGHLFPEPQPRPDSPCYTGPGGWKKIVYLHTFARSASDSVIVQLHLDKGTLQDVVKDLG